MRPTLRLAAIIACCFVASLVMAGVHLWHSALTSGPFTAALNAQRVTVRVGDLLSLLITVSGITIPILIAYMLVKSKDLQISIAERAIFHLDQNGIKMEQFHSARLVLADENTPLTPTEAMQSVIEAVGLGSHENAETLTEIAQNWLLSTPKLRQIYNGCFTAAQDRSVIIAMIWVVGVSAVLCFMDMYARFYGISGLSIDAFEQFIVPFTGIMNIIAYGTLVWIVQMKVAIRQSAFAETKKVCGQVKPEIESAIRFSEQQKGTLRAALQPNVGLQPAMQTGPLPP